MKSPFSYTILLLSLATALLVACERPADVDVPITPSKLAATAWISPEDTILRVMLTRSVPTFGASQDASPFVENATVRLSDGVNTATLNYNFNALCYEVEANALNIVPGGQYALTAEQGGEVISAETIIPTIAATINEAEAEHRVTTQTEFSSIFIDGKVVWNDPQPNEFNYYALVMVRGFTSWDGTSFLNESQRFLLTDADLNNNTITFRPSLELFSPVDSSTFVRYYLMTVNRDYYEFHRTAQLNDFGGGPFSEPVLIYTNVQNGLGAFGAYLSNRTEVPVRIVE